MPWRGTGRTREREMAILLRLPAGELRKQATQPRGHRDTTPVAFECGVPAAVGSRGSTRDGDGAQRRVHFRIKG